MSVPPRTLSEEFRSELRDFYGRHFGWREVESLRRADRLTMAIGGESYLNVRERPESMVTHGYEHVGLLLGSPEDVERAWTELDAEARDVHLEPLSSGREGYRAFRFRYLLPFAVELQFIPPALAPHAVP